MNGSLRVFYSEDYVRASHAYETTRKAGWVAESLRQEPISGVTLVAPRALTAAAFHAVHSPAYVEAVRVGHPKMYAESQGFAWDPGLWTMVCATNGGMVAGALAALEDGVSGSLSSGFHHARRDQGTGYCTFNGLALAARAALQAGARSVLVLDLDAHCGGGTYSILAHDQNVFGLDVSVSPYDRYAPASGAWTLDVVDEATDYASTLHARLAALERTDPPFGLCLYNAGMDPSERNVDGRSGVTDAMLAAREDTVFQWCVRRRTPIAFALAGGYLGHGIEGGLDEAGLVGLHRLTVASAARAATALWTR